MFVTGQCPDALAGRLAKKNAPRTAAQKNVIIFPLKIFMFMDLVSLIAEYCRGQNILNGF